MKDSIELEDLNYKIVFLSSLKGLSPLKKKSQLPGDRR